MTSTEESTKQRRRFFSRVYEENLWQGRESRSGQGSDVAQAANLIARLPRIFQKYDVGTLLDIPCGDFNWMKEVDFGATAYIGGDIVPEIIAANQIAYGSEARKFVLIDLVRDPLPDAKAIFIRDCFIHFQTDLIFESLENIARSSVNYVFLTHDKQHDRYPNGENIELDSAKDGINFYFRPLDFELPPFSFPPPIDFIPEEEHRKDSGDGDVVMAVWEIGQLRSALASRNSGR